MRAIVRDMFGSGNFLSCFGHHPQAVVDISDDRVRISSDQSVVNSIHYSGTQMDPGASPSRLKGKNAILFGQVDTAGTQELSGNFVQMHTGSAYQESCTSDSVSDESKEEDRDLSMDDMPEEVVEYVMRSLVGMDGRYGVRRSGKISKQDRKNMLAACGVSRKWRSIGLRVFFQTPWESYFAPKHPNQLFSTSPHDLKGSKSGLVKCFLRRDASKGGRRFALYLGKDSSQSSNKVMFMLSAVARGRKIYEIHLADATTKKVSTETICAMLRCNLLCTSYSLTFIPQIESSLAQGLGIVPHNASLVGMGSEDTVDHYCKVPQGVPENEKCILDLKYRARVQGMMQPRRMEVCVRDLGSRDESMNSDCAAEGSTSANATCPSPSSISIAQASSSSTKLVESVQQQSAKPLQLRNKHPHWNEDLHCWCLNFRGRVKLASVKNFQLVQDIDQTDSELIAEGNEGKVIMQFGKVEDDLFILDFNPTAVSAIQAFAIALSTFDGKLML